MFSYCESLEPRRSNFLNKMDIWIHFQDIFVLNYYGFTVYSSVSQINTEISVQTTNYAATYYHIVVNSLTFFHGHLAILTVYQIKPNSIGNLSCLGVHRAMREELDAAADSYLIFTFRKILWYILISVKTSKTNKGISRQISSSVLGVYL